MNTRLDVDPLLPDGGLGLMVRIDGGQPLAELTDVVNALCEQVERREEKSVAILHLGGTATDHREWPGDVDIRTVNRWERAVRRLEKLGAVSIAVAQGTCAGPALDLLLSADFRIGSPDLRLMLPVNDGHFWPGMVLFRLVQHIGLARARQIVLWGTDLPLERATELGLIDRVSDDIAEAVRTTTVLVGRISDQETMLRRQLLMEAGSVEYDEALGVHLAACDRELRRLRNVAVAETAAETADPAEA
jgi:isomerase DpgB